LISLSGSLEKFIANIRLFVIRIKKEDRQEMNEAEKSLYEKINKFVKDNGSSSQFVLNMKIAGEFDDSMRDIDNDRNAKEYSKIYVPGIQNSDKFIKAIVQGKQDETK